MSPDYSKRRMFICGTVAIGRSVYTSSINYDIDYILVSSSHYTPSSEASDITEANRFFHARVAETKQLIKVLKEDFEDIYIDAELQAEKREGWLKPHKQLNPITYSGNSMIDRLINNRVREPG